MFAKRLIQLKDQHILSLKEEIEDLKSQRETLFKKIDKLQEAVIAVHSPVAYQEMKYDERTQSVPPEIKEKFKQEREFTENYLRGLEEPLFKSVDELSSLLTNMIGGNEPASLHNNEES